jgi:hypothetical protein
MLDLREFLFNAVVNVVRNLVSLRERKGAVSADFDININLVAENPCSQ